MHEGITSRSWTESGRLVLGATLALVFFGLVLHAVATGIGNYALDDAYIVEHSVRGILEGRESRFVGASPWDGVTSPVYVGAVALLSSVAPVEISHWLVSTLATLSLAAAIVRLCRMSRLGYALTVTIVLVSLTVGMTSFQLTNGLETGLAMSALTWTIVALEQEPTPRWGYVLAGIQPFLRPELAAMSVIFWLSVISRRPPGWTHGAVLTLASLGGSALALFLASGEIVPNTLSAKTYFFAEACLPPPSKAVAVALALHKYAAALGIFSAGFVMACWSRHSYALFAFATIFVLAYFLKLPGGLFHNDSRYLYTLQPIAVAGWIAWLAQGGTPYRRVALIVGSLAVGVVLYRAPESFGQQIVAVDRVSSDNTDMANWVANNVPPDAVVMVHDAGRISTIGRQPLVDLVGLKSTHSVGVHRDTTFKKCRRVPEALATIAADAGASYLVVTRDWNMEFGLTRSLQESGFSVERADRSRSHAMYEVYQISSGARQLRAH